MYSFVTAFQDHAIENAKECQERAVKAEALAKICEDKATAADERVKEVERRFMNEARSRQNVEALLQKLQADIETLNRKV